MQKELACKTARTWPELVGEYITVSESKMPISYLAILNYDFFKSNDSLSHLLQNPGHLWPQNKSYLVAKQVQTVVNLKVVLQNDLNS